MSRNVTTDLRLGIVSLTAHVQGPEQGARPRSTDRGATARAQENAREGLRDPHPWVGAAADEFPPGFAEFAEARGRGMAIARANPSGA